jgi:hypothetical protein
MKDKKKVLKQYPNAKLLVLEDGTHVIENDDTVLAEEFFLPDAYDEDTAWKYAALACKTSQHFNRTHPARMELSNKESKFTRIKTRRRNAEKNKRTV